MKLRPFIGWSMFTIPVAAMLYACVKDFGLGFTLALLATLALGIVWVVVAMWLIGD